MTTHSCLWLRAGTTFSALALLCLAAPAQRPDRPSSRPESSRPSPAPSRPAPEISRPAPSRPAPEVSRPAPSRPAPEVSRPAPSRPAPEVSRPAPSRPAPEVYSRPSQPESRPSSPEVRYVQPESRRNAPEARRNPPAPAPAPTPEREAPGQPSRRVYDNSTRLAPEPQPGPRVDPLSSFGTRARPTPIPSPASSLSTPRSAPNASTVRSAPQPIRSQAPTREEILKRYQAKDNSSAALSAARSPSLPAPANARAAQVSLRQPSPQPALEEARARKLTRMQAQDPVKTREVIEHGEDIAQATQAALRVGVSATFGATTGCGSGWTWWDPCNNNYYDYYPWYHCGPGSYYWANGCTYWLPSFGWGFSFGSCSSLFFSTSWYWGSHCAYDYPRYNYWCASPWWYTNVIYVDREPEVIYVREEAPVVIEVPAAEGEVVVAAKEYVQPRQPERIKSLARVAEQYLALGDLAFRERRYTDAVSHYARAIEFSPGDAVLYLVLSDALFAAGDYHYAAFALKKSLEIEPRLVETIVDKHSFYNDPADFEKQLSYLERFLADHPEDDDARLVLAANYLFGNKPNQALELLRSGLSANVRALPAGKLLMERAEAAVAATPFSK